MDVALPLDFDGFLRRECPNCEQEFKWHNGKTDAAPEDYLYPDVHWCPLCGESAALDQWWTPRQLEYVRSVAAGPVIDQLTDDLFKGLDDSKFVKVTRNSSKREVPDPLVEPDDMTILEPPCHPWEPIKVPDNASPPFYCLICGEAFTV